MPSGSVPGFTAHPARIGDPTGRALLRSPVNSATAAARGFDKLPYTGFPATLTVAQSPRPYPQFGDIPVHYAEHIPR
jgi:hypothetical protein